MDALIAVTAHLAAGLVLVAGIGKLLRPSATREALALSPAPSTAWLVRTLGAGEIALALGVLALGGRTLFLGLALAYVGFLGVAEHQRRTGRSCGCFGASNATVGPLHLGVDGIAATAAIAAAWLGTPGLPAVLPGDALGAFATLGLLAVAVALAQLALTALPELLAVRARAARGTAS